MKTHNEDIQWVSWACAKAGAFLRTRALCDAGNHKKTVNQSQRLTFVEIGIAYQLCQRQKDLTKPEGERLDVTNL